MFCIGKTCSHRETVQSYIKFDNSLRNVFSTEAEQIFSFPNLTLFSDQKFSFNVKFNYKAHQVLFTVAKKQAWILIK